jgi:hypothetical protein
MHKCLFRAPAVAVVAASLAMLTTSQLGCAEPRVDAPVVAPTPSASAMPVSSAPKRRAMSFFVTSVGIDGSADLGGLRGADAHCDALARDAAAIGSVWRAYLSTSATAGEPGADARDRIGAGPWYNARGELVARDVAELHGDRNGITRHAALTERGEPLVGAHDILTGSTEDGRLARTDGVPASCSNWTSSGAGIARIGHHDRVDAEAFDNARFKRLNGSWNSEHDTIGCGAAQLARTGGGGHFYCFAADVVPRHDDDVAAREATFARGVNVNHWIGDNLPETMLPGATYGAPWFDDEDVRWIAAQGFDHVRVWVAGDRWVRRDGELDEAALAPFDRLLAWATEARLGVVLAMHGTPGFRAGLRGAPPAADSASPFTDAVTRDDAAYLWWLVARRYALEGDTLRFELIARPEADDAASMQAFNRGSLAAIRRVDPARVVYLAAHAQQTMPAREVDLSDPRTALSVPFWEPEAFTYQIDPRAPLVSFPGPAPERRGVVAAEGPASREAGAFLSEQLVSSRVAQLVESARARAPRPIYVAEFGVAKRADDASAERWLRAARSAFDRHSLGWAVYDYHTAFAVRDRAGAPTRVIEGLGLGEGTR